LAEIKHLPSPTDTLTWTTASKDITALKGKTVKLAFVMYNDATEASGLLIDKVSIRALTDTTKPVGSVSIGAGAIQANKSTVVLKSSASDVGGSGVKYMRFSNNGYTWSPWKAYATTTYWSLTSTLYGGGSTEGTKKVYAQYKDLAGNVSGIVGDNILYNPRYQPLFTITSIKHDPTGVDNYNLKNEYIVIRNNLRGTVELTKWIVKDAAGNKYTIPTFKIWSGGSFTLRSGVGTNTYNTLYMKRATEMWSNPHDSIYLYSPDGKLVLKKSY